MLPVFPLPVCREARLALGALAPFPVRAYEAEEFLQGRKIDEETAAQAAELALAGARPLSRNGYKVVIAKTLIFNFFSSSTFRTTIGSVPSSNPLGL